MEHEDEMIQNTYLDVIGNNVSAKKGWEKLGQSMQTIAFVTLMNPVSFSLVSQIFILFSKECKESSQPCSKGECSGSQRWKPEICAGLNHMIEKPFASSEMDIQQLVCETLNYCNPMSSDNR